MECLWPSLIVSVGLALSACSGGGGTPSPAPIPNPPVVQPTPVSDPIPRLPEGPHIGTIVGFDPLTSDGPDRAGRVTTLLADLQNAGATIGRVQLDWGGLETAPGVFDRAAVDDAIIEARAAGPLVFFTLSTLDSDGLTLPDDLLENGDLRAGLTLSSPEVIERFEAFLDWLIPIVRDEDVWGIALGNEVDLPVEDAIATAGEARVFFEAGFARVDALDQDMATSVTFTPGAPRRFGDEFSALVDAMDLVTFNYYCLDESIQVTRKTRWDSDIRDLKSAAEGKPIFLQELGCPVGYGDDGVGAPSRPANGLMGTAEIQVEFFEDMTARIASDPQLRAATVFQLLDWSPELAKSFSDPLRDAGSDLAADRLEEWLATVGLCRWADATCRDAWPTLLNGVQAIRDARPAD
ncbi:MAG: hypothetical protein AAGH90_07010 [Pseudomonadota bacterium]